MFLENHPTVELPKSISASRVLRVACVRSPCNAFPPKHFLRLGGISDILHGIYYLLLFIFHFRFVSFSSSMLPILLTFIPIPVTIRHEHLKFNRVGAWAGSKRGGCY
ncbi:hypothetical protein BDV26DRAFT_260955 [Aspergillus bertholletiae]|uniref:Uncharacterized protein n=1 Tax=Aspergillus bertholletiae TaxID=1226010 RepID=A0A5N7BAL9_9EURO|nr:hypothetical protein BDV26DRAFT_260955 [Aspergillus bertholletiae]